MEYHLRRQERLDGGTEGCSTVSGRQYGGGNLEGAHVDAILDFPGRLKQALTNWRVGPESSVDDQDVQIVQATTPSGFLVKLYFDSKTGLLLRSVRYSDSPVGRVPVRVDYSDYRAVSCVKVPFKRVATWTDGRTVFQWILCR